MFTGRRRSRHDFDLTRQAFVANAYLRGEAAPDAVRHYLRWRQEALRGDADVCGLNQHTMSLWPEVAPDAVFVLTIRDPLEWVDALARALTMVIPAHAVFSDLRVARCRPDLWPAQAGDAPLRSRGLFSLDAYLGWWASATSSALDSLPAERLVVVPTAELPDSGPRLARATGWGDDAMGGTERLRNSAPSWPSGRSVIDEMPPDHVAAAVRRQLQGIDWARLRSVRDERTAAILGEM